MILETNVEAVEKTVATTILGMVEALRVGAIGIRDAEKVFFSPAVMHSLRTLKVSDDLIEVVHLGTELEDVIECESRAFEECLNEISIGAIAFLKTKDELDLNYSMWLMDKMMRKGELAVE
ncbi:DUF3969 family protein [Parasedimentitalea marina]|uniref:DUF3969 family protein n=1 Tax=Parasedimentitalea marina TaxID=2483033 RepID=A0A3T0N478_9RHOB|nr:DUF3969 family protein [Parasedimentitalea marina]AZV78804.1 DUF3969 family protein [Parasedimentitalea marina]